MWRKRHCHKNIYMRHQYEFTLISPCTSDYKLCFRIQYNAKVYNKYSPTVTLSIISFQINVFKLLSHVSGLIRRLLYLIFIAPHCKVTMPLDQQCVIKNRPITVISYFCMEHDYQVWLYLQLLSHLQLLYYFNSYYFLILHLIYMTSSLPKHLLFYW